ncbi:MAG: hypothetical protein KDA29_13200 [Phycisphaerales bacterium]|nr:hypothetical protein [Phycisphaerales bacterium]
MALKIIEFCFGHARRRPPNASNRKLDIPHDIKAITSKPIFKPPRQLNIASHRDSYRLEAMSPQCHPDCDSSGTLRCRQAAPISVCHFTGRDVRCIDI